MKDAINKYLRRFGIEIHGVGYIQKLRNSDLKKSEWSKQQELLKSKADVIFDVGLFVKTKPVISVDAPSTKISKSF